MNGFIAAIAHLISGSTGGDLEIDDDGYYVGPDHPWNELQTMANMNVSENEIGHRSTEGA